MRYFGFDRPSFAFKTFGFGESSPKVQADFTAGTYKSDGATKTFADLFTFNRAGKAWLVKDTGSVEYAADVPRFDNGLLVEKEATNLATWALQPDKWQGSKFNYVYITNIDGENTGVIATGNSIGVPTFDFTSKTNSVSAMYYIGQKPENLIDYTFLLRNSTTATNLRSYGFIEISTTNFKYSDEHKPNIFKVWGDWNDDIGIGDGLSMYQGRVGDTNGITLIWYARQITPDTLMSSLIKTEDVPVTRPADFLTSKITGTTITGDWDSTLSLSLVNGQIAHTGYGRIRSLEIT